MIIYKVTNLENQKIYIGQTINSLEHRKNGHYRDANCSKKKNTYFHNALLKYPKDSFIWEEIETCQTKEELDKREQYWISYYKSNEIGYNLKAGGQLGGGVNSQSTKNKIGETSKLKWANPIIAEKMREGLRKGTETCKKKALLNFKESFCKICGNKITYRPIDISYVPKYCSDECRNKDQLIIANKASQIAKDKLKEKYLTIDEEIRSKIINWFKFTKLENISYNNLRDIFSQLSELTGLKDDRSIMRPFGFTSRKKFVKELLKIYAEQV